MRKFFNFFKNLFKKDVQSTVIKDTVESCKSCCTKDKIIGAFKWVVNIIGKIFIVLFALLIISVVILLALVYAIALLISSIFKIISRVTGWIHNTIDNILMGALSLIDTIITKINSIAHKYTANDDNIVKDNKVSTDSTDGIDNVKQVDDKDEEQQHISQ